MLKELKEIKFDGPFDIATGRSRKETHWRNQEMTWSAFLKRISETHRTPEKLTEYMAYKKPLQDERKDVGGYVGGYVNNGRRKSENITHRQLLTLDIDFSKGGLQDDCEMLYDNAAAVYSTHKNSPENPRLRLIMPLDRPVAADEYVAIARRIAGALDINCFDDTTYEPSRLMYWPSTSKDGEYVFEYQDGPWLCADKVLASYKNWRDASEWPVSDRAGEVIHREIKKQGDPLEKPGVVGAFCRTYDIHEAIETFLDEEYEPCDIEGRYTYREGSTAAGLVVYDDKYAYSHHGTDPASGKLCNAFDLVRLHVYGLKDEDSKEGTPGNKLPSYQAMMDLSMKDKSVRKTLAAERMQDLKDDFAEFYQDKEEDDESEEWQTLLEVNRKGGFIGRVTDFEIVLENHPAFKGKLAKNEFKNTWDIIGKLPWKNTKTEWTDADFNQLISWMEKFGMPVNISRLDTALNNVINNNCYHPVREYLNSLSWDGEERLETVFIDYLGADDSEYVKVVTRKSLVAAVARIENPGCKFDHVLVLVGPQSLGKSTFVNKLGKGYSSDSFHTMIGKEAFEALQGVWLIELAELAGLKKAEIELVKHFISKQIDRYRVAYGHRTEEFPRQCVFIATTNTRDFLHDTTGNRRFWPVDLGELKSSKNIWKDLDEYEVDQIWAEAVKMYKAGETLYLTSELEAEANRVQTDHREVDDRTGIIQDYLDTLLPENWNKMDYFQRRSFLVGDDLQEKGTMQRTHVCMQEIWLECFGKQKADLTKYNTKDLHTIMKTLKGWEECSSFRSLYGTQRGYKRIQNVNKQFVNKKELFTKSVNNVN